MAITKVAALAFLMLNLFTPPCFAAIGAMNSEMKSKKWLFAGLGLQLGMGYSLAFIVYFFGTLFTGSGFDALWMPLLGFAIVIAFGAVITVLCIKSAKSLKANENEKNAAVV